MTTETLTPALEAPATETPVAAPASTGNTYSVVALVLSILSIPMTAAPLAIAGIVLGFIGRSKEPAARTTSLWAIIVGFVSLFGWIVFGLIAAVIFGAFVLSGNWDGWQNVDWDSFGD